MVGLLVVAMTLGSACGSIPMPSIPNPFRSDPTPTPAPSPAAKPADVVTQFDPFWVRNHRLTEMWSGAAGQTDAVSFGTTSNQFCAFLVVRAPEGARLFVYNPYTDNYLWLDADAIGPSGPPEQRSDPKPENQNCADALYGG